MKPVTIYILSLSLLLNISCAHYHNTRESENVTRESGLPSLCLLRSIIKINPNGTSAIIGQVRDRETDETIIGANINLKGTKYGAATDSLGNYIINNIPAGIYKIQANALPYHQVSFDSLNILANEVIILDFRVAQAGIHFTP